MRHSRKTLKPRAFLLMAFGVALALSGCGDPKPLAVADSTAVPAPASTVEVLPATEVPAPAATTEAVEPDDAPNAPAEPAAASAVGVTVIDSEFGQILVDGTGLSLYAFIDDVDGVSVCEGGCAEAWPPLVVDTAALFAGLDTSVVDPATFSVVPRSDGSNQLKAGDWPLYLFAGDTNPGDTTGHLSGNVWFLVAPDGSLIDGPASDSAEDVVEEEATGVPATPVPAAEPTPIPATPIPATPVPAVPAPTPGG